MCQDYINFCNELSHLSIPKDRIDLMFEDGYTAQEAIDEWEWEQDMDMHEWSAHRKAQLTELGAF